MYESPTELKRAIGSTEHVANLGRVHTDNLTRRAYRSRTVRVGLPVYTLIHCVGFVRYTQTTSGCVRSGRERFASAWLCSVNARVDASDASGRERRTVCPCLLTDLSISTDTIHMTRKGDICHELSRETVPILSMCLN